jgi:3-hydroxyisobutyrate dehydrogenase
MPGGHVAVMAPGPIREIVRKAIDSGSGLRQATDVQTIVEAGDRDGRDLRALRLGWLGLGRMGSALARRLLAAGCDVGVYNRTAAKAEPFGAAGAEVAPTPAALAARDIVFVTVGTSEDLLDAVLGPGGLMSSDAAPTVLVDCSTISAEASGQIRRELARRGTALLAAPVMGNPRVASAGKLTLAVSGPRDAYETARPYLDLLGAGATYVGEGELARIVKLCHNLFLGVVTQSLAEVTILAQKSGVSRQAFLDCLNRSVMGSAFTRYKSPAFVNLDFHPTFTATLLRKDFDLGLAAAREAEVPLPVAALVHQIVQSLVGHGYADQDFAALIELQAQACGLRLESENAEVTDGLGPAGQPH